ncbi:MAG: alpha/beta fold hydrolase [Desulfuromonadales bacterium]|nr:alpha/beta fold hydrolase [Desulfuromonadales bacterium]
MVTGALEAEYPFKSNFLNLNGLKYHYLDEGTGKPILMLHGNPSWSFYYRNLVKALSPNYRCIVPDHIGCGFSDKPDDKDYDYTLAQRVDDLEELIKHLGIKEKITPVLHDWGGMIGMAWAAKHSEMVKRLVILNTAAFHLPKEKPFPLALKICRDTALGALLVRGFNAFSLAASFVGCKKNPMPPALRKLYRLPYNSWKNRIATLRFVQDIPLKKGDRNYDLVTYVSEGLEQFSKLPVMILWGEKDFVFDRYFLDEWCRRFPGAEIHSWPDAGHYVLEDMKEEIIPIIKGFLLR